MSAETPVSGKRTGEEKLLASNPSARQDYVIEEIVEAGLVLTGTEIKSLRAQSPNLRDSFVDIQPRGASFEAFLLNAHIGPYSHGNIWNHEAVRRRKLLLHRHQLKRMYGALTQKGLTIVPTRMYLKNGIAKIELALAKGKKKGDKRANLREKVDRREIQQIKRSKL